MGALRQGVLASAQGLKGGLPSVAGSVNRPAGDSRGTGSLLVPGAGRAGRVSCLSLYAAPMRAPPLALGLCVHTRKMGQLALTAPEHRKGGGGQMVLEAAGHLG